MSDSDVKEMEIRVRSKDSVLRTCIGPELMRAREKSPEKRPFHFDGFSSLTTLCGDCITCNVHRIRMSWRKKPPLISPVTSLRMDYSGSFNVLNHWQFGPGISRVWINKKQHETLEPIGTSRRLNWSHGMVKGCAWCQNTWGSCYSNFEFLHCWLHYARVQMWLQTKNHIVEMTDLREQNCRVARAYRRSIQSSCIALDFISRQGSRHFACNPEVSLNNSPHSQRRQKEIEDETWTMQQREP